MDRNHQQIRPTLLDVAVVAAAHTQESSVFGLGHLGEALAGDDLQTATSTTWTPRSWGPGAGALMSSSDSR